MKNELELLNLSEEDFKIIQDALEHLPLRMNGLLKQANDTLSS